METTANYRRLDGSERHPGLTATLVGPVDQDERFEVTIVLRRPAGSQPLPGPDHFLLPPSQRRRLDGDDFAALYGASPEDIERVTEFVNSHRLTVVDTNAAQQTVSASGTAQQMGEAFAVDLSYYQHEITRKRGAPPETEKYRGRDGFVHVPQELYGVIVGVFGLDNRTITKHNSGDPASNSTISVSQATSLYNFPANSAAGETIAIYSTDGYAKSDITASFAPSPAPTVTDVSVDASNDGFDPYGETTQDIYIAASAAPGANVAVYFTTGDQKGWVDLVKRVAHPDAGDPNCSVLSSSFYICNGDDSNTLANEGVSTAFLSALTDVFQDAALQSVTVCVASGDTGTDSKVGDGKAHVQYPATDPWVLSVGGTTVGNISGSAYDEYVGMTPFNYTGATGGGISDFFPLPSYQNNAGVPTSLNDKHVGRGVPDVAANASPNSGYPLTWHGSSSVGNGTSASAPLWAGLVAVINASLGEKVGFINPMLYSLGSSVFRDITSPPGPADNGLDGVSGYPAGAGWDACTGWGSPNGKAILASLKQTFNKDCVFVTDRSTFSSTEVAAMLKQAIPAVIPNAFYIQVDGFRPQELGITSASLSGVPDVYPTITPANPIPGMTVGSPAGKPTALLAQDSSLYPAPQRLTWVFPVSFSDISGFVPGGQTITLTASIGGVSGSA
ncbi:subtilisin-like protein, partial [Thozetella sp. PMI_491]